MSARLRTGWQVVDLDHWTMIGRIAISRPGWAYYDLGSPLMKIFIKTVKNIKKEMNYQQIPKDTSKGGSKAPSFSQF